MATRKEQEILHGNLRLWFNRLGYRVTDTEVKVITKNSRNAEFWKLVQKLVLPGDDIKIIRSKLACYQRKQDYNAMKHDVNVLQQEKEKLLAKISASKSRSSQSLVAINSMKGKIRSDANKKTADLQILSNNTMKEVLQKSLIKHCSGIQTKFTDNCNSLDLTTSRRCQLSREPPAAPVFLGKGILETPCSREITSVLSQIKTFIGSHISESTEDPAVKNGVWDAAAKVYNHYSPEEIITSIKTVTSQQTTLLVNKTESHNIDEHLQSLNFGMVEGNIVSKVENSDPEKDLEAHARIMQSKVSKEFIEMLKNKSKAKELDVTVNILQTEIENQIQSLPWSSDKKSSLSALLKFKLREKELDSKDSVIKSEIERLQNEKDQATKEKIQTFKTHRSIIDFKKNQEKKQEVIKTLVGQTGSLKTALDTQTSNVKLFVTEKLVPTKELFFSKLSSINMYPQVMGATITNIPLDRIYLSSLPASSCPVADLSIYQFERSPNYHKLLSSTALSLHLDSESFLRYVSRIICLSNSRLLSANFHDNILKYREADVPNSTDVFETLREALYDFDTFTSEQILDKIKKSETKVQASINKCSSFSRMISTFSEQPAQHLIPWVLVNEMSLKDVQEKWLVQSSR